MLPRASSPTRSGDLCVKRRVLLAFVPNSPVRVLHLHEIRSPAHLLCEHTTAQTTQRRRLGGGDRGTQLSLLRDEKMPVKPSTERMNASIPHDSPNAMILVWSLARSNQGASSPPFLLPALALLILSLIGVGAPQSAQAQSPTMGEQERSGVALSVQASTMGPSVGLHVGVSETVRIRARGAFLPYSFSRDLDGDDVDARVDGDLQIGGPEIRLDWHPFRSSFHLSGGVLYNITEADALIFPTSSYEFNGDKTFSEEKIGEMDAKASYSSISPYAGLGFGNALAERWSFRVELGAYYVGSPEFDFGGEGLIEPTERNEAILADGFESFQFYPHFAFGLSYQF